MTRSEEILKINLSSFECGRLMQGVAGAGGPAGIVKTDQWAQVTAAVWIDIVETAGARLCGHLA